MRRTAQAHTSRRIALVALVSGLLVTNLGLLVACGRSSTAGPTASGAPLQAAAPAPSNAVTVANFAFSPPTVTVTVGDTVTWTSGETFISHTVTSDPGAPASFNHLLGPQDTFSFQFTIAGTYPYHCNIHASMHGTIVVNAAATATPTPTSTTSPAATSTTSSSSAPTATSTSTSSSAPTATTATEPTPTPTNEPEGK